MSRRYPANVRQYGRWMGTYVALLGPVSSYRTLAAAYGAGHLEGADTFDVHVAKSSAHYKIFYGATYDAVGDRVDLTGLVEHQSEGTLSDDDLVILEVTAGSTALENGLLNFEGTERAAIDGMSLPPTASNPFATYEEATSSHRYEWRVSTEGLAASAVAAYFEQADGTGIAVTRSGGVYKRVNSGSQWLESNAGIPALGYGQSLNASPFDENVLLAGVNNRIYRSLDGGDNWVDLYTPSLPCAASGLVEAVVDPVTGRAYIGFILSSCAFWGAYIEDIRVSWDVVEYAADTGVGNDTAYAFPSPKVGHLAMGSGPYNQLRRTVDGGANWVNLVGDAAEREGTALWHPSDADKVWFFGNGFYASTDAGLSWLPIAGTSDWVGTKPYGAATPDGTTFYACVVGRGVALSEDGGASWSIIPATEGRSFDGVGVFNGAVYFYGFGGFFEYMDGELFEQTEGLPNTLNAPKVDVCVDGGQYVGINSDGMYKRVGNSLNWELLAAAPVLGTYYTGADVADSQLVIVTELNTAIYTSTDGGASFTRTPIATAEEREAVGFDLSYGGIGYYNFVVNGSWWVCAFTADFSEVYFYKWSGSSYELKLTSEAPGQLLADPGDSDHLLVGVGGSPTGGMHESFDNGETWSGKIGTETHGVSYLQKHCFSPSGDKVFVVNRNAGEMYVRRRSVVDGVGQWVGDEPFEHLPNAPAFVKDDESTNGALMVAVDSVGRLHATGAGAKQGLDYAYSDDDGDTWVFPAEQPGGGASLGGGGLFEFAQKPIIVLSDTTEGVWDYRLRAGETGAWAFYGHLHAWQVILTGPGADISTGFGVPARAGVSGELVSVEVDCDPNQKPVAEAVQVQLHRVSRGDGARSALLSGVAEIAAGATKGVGVVDGVVVLDSEDVLQPEVVQGSDGQGLSIWVGIRPET